MKIMIYKYIMEPQRASWIWIIGITYMILASTMAIINTVTLMQLRNITATEVNTYMYSGVMFGLDVYYRPVSDTSKVCMTLYDLLNNDIIYNRNVSSIAFMPAYPTYVKYYILDHPLDMDQTRELAIIYMVILALFVCASPFMCCAIYYNHFN